MRPAMAFDRFDGPHAPSHFGATSNDATLVVKGDLRLSIHDLEGRGGPGFDSPTDTRTIGTRSTYASIDTCYLAGRLQLQPSLAVNTSLALDATAAHLDEAWFDFRFVGPADTYHHVEVGRRPPFVATDRRTARYPLAGTLYWRSPEMHVTYEVATTPLSPLGIAVGISAALVRPLGFAPVQNAVRERGTINVLSYDPERVYSGVSGIYGGKFALRGWGVTLEGFGFAGHLAAEAGTDELLSNFDNVQSLGGNATQRQLLWGGGRATLDLAGFLASLEAITSQDGLLQRFTWYAQLSYPWRRGTGADLLPGLEPLVRYEQYRLRHSTEVHADGRALRSPALSQAITWDFDITTLALIARLYREFLELRCEYTLVREYNGVRALRISNSPFRNNEAQLELAVRF